MAIFDPILIPEIFTCTALTTKRKEIRSRTKRRWKDYGILRTKRTYFFLLNLSNINGNMLQKAWGFKIGEDGIMTRSVQSHHKDGKTQWSVNGCLYPFENKVGTPTASLHSFASKSD